MNTLFRIHVPLNYKKVKFVYLVFLAHMHTTFTFSMGVASNHINDDWSFSPEGTREPSPMSIWPDAEQYILSDSEIRA